MDPNHIEKQPLKRKKERTEAHFEAPSGILTQMANRPGCSEEGLTEKVCEKHAGFLDFFCRDEKECICQLCRTTDHKDHNTVAIEEEVNLQKETVASRQEKIQQKINKQVKNFKDFSNFSTHNKVRMNKYIEESDKLFNNLIGKVKQIRDELKSDVKEKLRSSEEWEQAIVQLMKRDIKDLQKKKLKLEEISQNEDRVEFLQALNSMSDTEDLFHNKVRSDNYMESKRKAMSNLVHIFQRKLRSVTKKELKGLREYKDSVTFDPSTAGPYLVVTESGTRLKHSKKPSPAALADSSHRFKSHMVLGTDGFISGRHYWEVQVGWRNDWDVGVAKKTVDKSEEVIVKKENGFFSIGKLGYDYQANCSPCKVLHLSSRPKHVGVYLDYEAGRVSFYDVDQKLHIYTFRERRFTGKLFPYFYMYSSIKRPGTLVITTT